MIVDMPRMRPIDKPVVPPGYHSMPDGTSMKGSTHSGGSATNPLEGMVNNYLRAAPIVAKTAAANNFFNPFPSIAQAGLEGRNPTRAEVGTDAAFAAVGFLPVGKGASQLAAIVRKLNKSTNVGDFMTPQAMRSGARLNGANEGLYRPGAQSFNYENVPEPASPYTFGLVPTEKLSPLREFDRAAEPAGRKATGPDNIKKLADHMAEGGKWSDPTAVSYYPDQEWAYLAEGNHRLALAEALGLEQLPTTVWREKGLPLKLFSSVRDSGQKVGRRIGPLDTNQLKRDPYGTFPGSVGDFYVPPTMNPYLLKYFQQ